MHTPVLSRLCSCVAELFVKFLDSFYAQLEQAPDEMTQGALQGGNFLSNSCAALLETCVYIDRTVALRALQAAPKCGSQREKGKDSKAIRGEQTDAASADAAVGENKKEAAACLLKAMEPHYKEVEKAAGRLCDLVRLLFKVTSGGGELGEISQLDEVLLALQGPDAPVVVDAAEAGAALGSCTSEPEEPMQSD